MGLGHYNRKGESITFDQWCQMFEHDENVRRVALTELPNGKRVSTVWLGLDHRYGDGPPLIFETMVFQGDSSSELDVDRYSTEAEALAGHERMVGKWSLIAGDSDSEHNDEA